MGFHRDFPLLPFDDQRVRFNSLSFDGDLAAIEHDLDDFMDKQWLYLVVYQMVNDG